MYKVHIRTESADKAAAVVEALKELRTEMVTQEEDDPFVDTLFFLSRMNSKLDNLGQLRHLFRLEQRILDLERVLKPVGQYFSMLQEEKLYERKMRREFYEGCVQDYGFKLPLSYELMTTESIELAFDEERRKRRQE